MYRADPYVLLYLIPSASIPARKPPKALKTATKKGRDVVFGEKFQFNVTSLSDVLHVEVWDWDFPDNDDEVR